MNINLKRFLVASKPSAHVFISSCRNVVLSSWGTIKGENSLLKVTPNSKHKRSYCNRVPVYDLKTFSVRSFDTPRRLYKAYNWLNNPLWWWWKRIFFYNLVPVFICFLIKTFSLDFFYIHPKKKNYLHKIKEKKEVGKRNVWASSQSLNCRLPFFPDICAFESGNDQFYDACDCMIVYTLCKYIFRCDHPTWCCRGKIE